MENMDKEIEQAAANLANPNACKTANWIEGAKYMAERMYSEEELKQAFKVGFSIGYGSDVHAIDEKNRTCEKLFEQFKKK